MKKGFLFYVGFLLLLLFGVAIVMLVVLFCSPGTEILGLKYFSNSASVLHTKTTDAAKTELKLSEVSYDKIQINVDYASVKVQASNSYDNDGIVIVNNSKGFVMAKDETKFSYSITLADDGDTLKIDVKEPTAFLFFSKDIQVIVHIATEDVNPFENTAFDITTKSGSITFGGIESSAYAYDFNVDDLTLKTDSGNISINKKVNFDSEENTQTFNGDLNINVGSGSFTARAENTLLYSKAVLQSTSGKISAGKLWSNRKVTMKTESGTYRIGTLICPQVDIECKNGYFYFTEVTGDINMPSKDSNIESPTLQVKTLVGDITVISGANLNLYVFDVEGNVNVSTTSGSVQFGKGYEGGISGEATIKTTSGSISTHIKNGNSSAKSFTTDWGQINVYLLGQVLKNTYVFTNTGNVRLEFVIGKAYTFDFAYSSKTEEFDMNKVNFVDFPNVTFQNGHYEYNKNASVRGTVEVYTDSNVTLQLINTQAA